MKQYNKSPGIIILDDLKLRVYERWLTNSWAWISDCVITNDERYAGMGLSPKRAYPVNELCLQYIWWESWQSRRVVVDKFRQGGATWLFGVLRNLYPAIFFEGSKCFILKRAFNEADQILKTRIMFVVNNFPERKEIILDGRKTIIHPKEWLPRLKYKEGEISIPRFTKTGKELPASYIYALEAGEDKARGVTGSNAVIDEGAFTSNLRKVWTSMDPAMEFMQCISSPKLGEFQDLKYGFSQS